MRNLAISRAPENLRSTSTDQTASARVSERDKLILQAVVWRIGTCKRRTLQLTNELGAPLALGRDGAYGNDFLFPLVVLCLK